MILLLHVKMLSSFWANETFVLGKKEWRKNGRRLKAWTSVTVCQFTTLTLQ